MKGNGSSKWYIFIISAFSRYCTLLLRFTIMESILRRYWGKNEALQMGYVFARKWVWPRTRFQLTHLAGSEVAGAALPAKTHSVRRSWMLVSYTTETRKWLSCPQLNTELLHTYSFALNNYNYSQGRYWMISTNCIEK